MLRFKKKSAKSVKSKLIEMQLLLSFLILFACSMAFIVNDFFIFINSAKQSIQTTAKILNRSLTPAMTFGDEKEAQSVLRALSSEPSITSAKVVDRNGVVFAKYNVGTQDFTISEVDLVGGGTHFTGVHLILSHRLGEDENDVGVLFLKADLRVFARGYKNYLWIVLMVFSVGLLVSYALAHIFQVSLSRPIVAIAKTAKTISRSGNYSLRMKDQYSNDIEEMATLSIEFNQMLDQIQAKDKKIQGANVELERTVLERTNELNEIQKIALENAHEAGMAEIATGILHNIGNITNSVNTSAEEIQRTVTHSKLGNLVKANEILKENLDRIGEFITHDPKGKVLPEFYIKTGEILMREHKLLIEEVTGLSKKIALIKDVIHTQQEYAKKELFIESIPLIEVVEEILSLQKTSLLRHQIKITKLYRSESFVKVQKVKLAHILMNLIKNAKEAMKYTEGTHELILETGIDEFNYIYLKITDTGEGIEPENLKKIFTHGFTTKKQGHGFGLHFCANSMKEMGGELSVFSEGKGRGATFLLRFNKVEGELKYG